MITTMQDALKKVLAEEEGVMILKLLIGKSKKIKEHNESMMNLLSLCQDENIVCTKKTKSHIELTIGKEYVRKILLHIKEIENEDMGE